MKYHDRTKGNQVESRVYRKETRVILSLRFSEKTRKVTQKTLENKALPDVRPRAEGSSTPNMGYLRLVVDTGRGWLTAYLNGRVLKRWPYKLLND